MLNLAGEIKNSNANGPKLRYVLFTQGCSHNPHCEGCQNPHTWSNKPCKLISVKEQFEIIKKELPLIKGVTFSGGEPFDQAVELANLAIKLKNIGLNIMCYTGFTYEQLIEKAILKEPGIGTLLKHIDILVDGKFDINKTDNPGLYRGSSNQRMLYLSKGKIIKQE